MGARGHSYYEYLLKQWIQSGKTQPLYLSMYEDAVEHIIDRLLRYSVPNRLAFITELGKLNSHSTIPKMDHLVYLLRAIFMELNILGTRPIICWKWQSSSWKLASLCRTLIQALRQKIVHFNTGLLDQKNLYYLFTIRLCTLSILCLQFMLTFILLLSTS